MKPGLLFVLDPHPHRAAECVAAMLDALGAVGQPQVRAARGNDWAAAAIAPPARLAGCDAGIINEHGDILIWTGDVVLPDCRPKTTYDADEPLSVGRQLLDRLRQRGIDALADIDGSFCGAWYAGGEDRWIVFNDRFGLIPVFYAASGDRIVIGPYAWLAWQATGRPLHLQQEGVVDVLRATNVMGDRTLIEGVHWLVGGSALLLPRGPVPGCRLETRTYWEYHNPPQAADKFEAAAEAGAEVILDTVRQQASGDAPLLMGISGGMDSRMILAACDALGSVPATYTLGWPFSEDVRFGRQLAAAAVAAHTLIEPQQDALLAHLPRLIVECDGLHSGRHLGLVTALGDFLADRAGSVLLEGYLLGMVGGSATVEDDDLPLDRPAHACRWAGKHFHAGGDIETINSLLLPEIARSSLQRWQGEIDDRYRRAPGGNPFERAEYTIMNGRSGRIDALGTHLLRTHAVVRSPGTTRRWLDFFASLPADWRRGKRLYMQILRRRFPRFARIQRANYSGLPISDSRWLREYCWQREKLYRLWSRVRYPQTRRWGTGGDYLTMWVFDNWRKGGDLQRLLEPDARVLNWLDRDRLLAAWQQAADDPNLAWIVMTAGTIETMVRWLERSKWPQAPVERVGFRFIETRLHSACEEAICASS